ncbi:MAG: glutamate-cysteine ligase family protein [Planctomycetota bacterium]
MSLFEGVGIEIETIAVDSDSLDVRPVADEVLRLAAKADGYVSDVDDGAIGWSNELVSHALELKTNGPAPSFEGLADAFGASLARMNAILERELDARTLPTGMHPWMDPRRETKLWQHEGAEVYAAYHQLFDCYRHGWSNVQSVHVNLPFADALEFARLMAATRLVLPLIPALAASSPIEEGRPSGSVDTRLVYYATNSKRVRSMTGAVIPEAIYDVDAYREQVLDAIDRELITIPATESLRGSEWSNARGAIARFDRMAIEIRLIDAQESCRADLAVAAAVTGLVRGLVEERTCSFRDQRTWSVEALRALFDRAVRDGSAAVLEDSAYARVFGVETSTATKLGALLATIAPRDFVGSRDLEAPLEHIVARGTLAERILRATGAHPTRTKLVEVYRRLADHQRLGTSFAP